MLYSSKSIDGTCKQARSLLSTLDESEEGKEEKGIKGGEIRLREEVRLGEEKGVPYIFIWLRETKSNSKDVRDVVRFQYFQ